MNASLIQNDKKYREYLEFIFKYEDKISPEFAKVEEFKIEYARQKKLNRELELKSKLVKFQINKSKNNLHSFIILYSLFTIAIVCGIIMAKNGFKKWYFLVQKPSDDKLNLEVTELKNKTINL